MLKRFINKLKDDKGEAMEFAFNKMLEFFCYALAIVFFCTFLGIFLLQYQLSVLTDNVCKSVSSEGGVNNNAKLKIQNAIQNAGGTAGTVENDGDNFVVEITDGHLAGTVFTISADWCSDGYSIQLEEPCIVTSEYVPELNGGIVKFHYTFTHTSTLASAKYYKN